MPAAEKNNGFEIEARTVEEAINLAVKQLKTKRENIEIKILREEKKGLFGMQGAELAKIRVRLKE